MLYGSLGFFAISGNRGRDRFVPVAPAVLPDTVCLQDSPVSAWSERQWIPGYRLSQFKLRIRLKESRSPR